MKKRNRTILLIVLTAALLRICALMLLPEDYDEAGYLQNAFDYAALFRAGDVNGIIDYTGNFEHPPLVKLIYAVGVLLPDTWVTAFYTCRVIAAVFGVLAVLLLSVLDPLSGALLAVQTLAVKYTSQVYLDAFASVFALASLLAFVRFDRRSGQHWFWLSAVALGITAASKQTYLPVTLVVLGYLALFEKHVPLTQLAAYGLVTLAVFFMFDCHLWHDPLNRLMQSWSYLIQYSRGEHVQASAYPWYQPFIWIFTSSPAKWHPDVFVYRGFDGIISFLAVVGLPREWKNRRWLVVWLVSGILILLIWPVKWPQYTLTLIPALCMMGAETLRHLWNWVRNQIDYWNLKSYVLIPTGWFWVALGIFMVFLFGVYLSAWGRLAIGKIGWTHLTTANSPLPSNRVAAMLPLDDGSLMIATDRGAAHYIPDNSNETVGNWVIYQRASGLVDDEVRCLARDSTGAFWFGTQAGISRTSDFITWTSFTAQDIQQASDTITALAATREGQLYAATLSGVSIWDGQTWHRLDIVQGQAVFTLTISGSAVWFGMATGVGRLDDASRWSFYPSESAVKQVYVDSSGQIWAATTGNGLAQLVDDHWVYHTVASSDIPLNQVNCISEVKPDTYWLGASRATTSGGVLATFDGHTWHTFDTSNSGFSGAEPQVILRTADNQVWIGTAGGGIDCYRLGE